MGRAHSGTHYLAASRRSGPRGPYKWTPERLEEELREFVGQGQKFPTTAELRAAGRSDLVVAITRSGGVLLWAGRLGLNVAPRQHRSPYSDSHAAADARALIDELGYLPGETYLRKQMGRHKLSTAVAKAGGAAAFRVRHGL